MYFKQILREDLGCAAYLVGSTDAGVAAVIDPRLDMVDEILALAESRGLRVTHIIETHNHADHVSGHSVLAERTGATIYIHPTANAGYPHEPFQDGDTLEVGEVVLRAIHTPGHRPEHIAVSVADRSRAEEPWLVLTGDSLFVGDVARPDLAVPGPEGAAAMYSSLFEKLLKLADGVEVYPAHVAGSLCGKVSNLKSSSTIGYERRFNAALAPRTVPEFVEYVTGSLPQRPPNMTAIVEVNRSRGGIQSSSRPLSMEEFSDAIEGGAIVLDTRTPGEFASGHVPGAINVDFGAQGFGTRVGFVIPPNVDLLLVVGEAVQPEDVVSALAVVAYTRVLGHLVGGMGAWTSTGRPSIPLPELSAQGLHAALGEDEPPTVLDVRERSEWEEGHIADAVSLPYHELPARVDSVPPGPVAVICGGGQRSSIASSLLQRAGRNDVSNVIGGMSAWKAAKYETGSK